MSDFYEDLRKAHGEKLERNYKERKRYVASGQAVYDNFCTWCFIFNGDKGQNNPQVFKKYLKEEGVKLTFWQKKNLLEKYFGYAFTYDYNNGWSVQEL